MHHTVYYHTYEQLKNPFKLLILMDEIVVHLVPIIMNTLLFEIGVPFTTRRIKNA